MDRKVFFSFKYEDLSRAIVVRDSWVAQGREAAGFIDEAGFKKLEKQGDGAVWSWIDSQLVGTSVTVVLVGNQTCNSRWVKYEIKKSIEIGNGLLGIDISKIKDLQGKSTERCGQIPEGYKFYMWHNDEGYNKIDDWIEAAVRRDGRNE